MNYSKHFSMYRYFFVLFFISNIAFSQKLDSLSKQSKQIDSIGRVVKDSVHKILDTNKVTFRKFVKVVFTNQPSPQKRPALKPTYRSMVLPGWGQATNKEYWVIPIIYGGAGAAIWNFTNNHKTYLLFRGVLQQIADKKKPDVIVYKGQTFQYETSDYERVLPIVKGFRRNRDLTTIAFFAGWALQTIQANVSAHLKSFDMSENISLRVYPTIQTGFASASAGVKINVNF